MRWTSASIGDYWRGRLLCPAGHSYVCISPKTSGHAALAPWATFIDPNHQRQGRLDGPHPCHNPCHTRPHVVEIPIREPAVLHTVLVALTASNLVDIVSGLVGRGATRRPRPRLSPGKSWRGFAGGFAASIAFAIAMAAIGAPPGQVAAWCLAVWLLTSTGDLVGSRLKRLGRVKDFSRHLGPHGGFMDRMDAIAPVIVWACLTA